MSVKTAESGTDLLELLGNRGAEALFGVTGSPSSTSEITIDIVEAQEEERILGQMVYLLQPHGRKTLVVIGQATSVETRNRWHEDYTFRGIVKRHHELPHLSGTADVREAVISVQAVYEVDVSRSIAEAVSESASLLATSPSTGARVYRMDDATLGALLSKYRSEVLFLGHVYGTDVKMPMWFKHFGSPQRGGVGEAYHVGVFGKTGSGKSGLAAYLLLCYARHPDMGIIVIDPQGQYSRAADLPFDLHNKLRRLGREVQVYSVATNLKLRDDAAIFSAILRKTTFFDLLGIRASTNQQYAQEEVERFVRDTTRFFDDAPDSDRLSQLLQHWRDTPRPVQMVYTSRESQNRVVSNIQLMLASDAEFGRLLNDAWRPVFDLFVGQDSQGNSRSSLWGVVASALGGDGAAPLQRRPVVILDLSDQGAETTRLRDDEVKALVLRQVTNTLAIQAGQSFGGSEETGRSANCLVVLDEAHRFASTRRDETEAARLAASLVDAVRTTRKFGLGWMFITQTLASLSQEIVQQLRIMALGYGLTSGSEADRVRDLINDAASLSLYGSFVDPASVSPKQFPFLFTGPVSPLSFTGSPLFVNVFNEFQRFLDANPWLQRELPT